MSYTRTYEYELLLKESYQVVRSCPGCKRKQAYVNTSHFRVNANGPQIDIWLIYQCIKCKHTLNLAIYERKRASEIPKDEYELFLKNDRELAQRYGTDRNFFASNKAEIIEGVISYILADRKENGSGTDREGQFHAGDRIRVHNRYGIKIRPDKIAAELLGITRSQEKKWEKNGWISFVTESRGLEIRINEIP